MPSRRDEPFAEIVIRVRDLPRIRLLVWELRQLADRLRAEGSPHADTLDRLLDRLTGEDP